MRNGRKIGLAVVLLCGLGLVRADLNPDIRQRQIKSLSEELAATSDVAQRDDLKFQLGELLRQTARPPAPGHLDQGGEGWWDATILPSDPSVSASGTTGDFANDFSVSDLAWPPNPCWEGYFSQTLSCAGPDVAYRYTAPQDGQYRMTLCNDPQYDSGLLVYQFTGGPPSNATDLICGNDDYCGLTSQLTTPPLLAGTELLIVVDGWNTSSGSYLLEVSLAELLPPPNDDCFAAQYIEPFAPVTGSTLDATPDDVPDCGTSVTTPGVWYVTLGTGNTLTASTCLGADYDTKLSVYSGDCTGPVCVGGNDDACGLSSAVTWCSVAGQPYFILVHGFEGQAGNFTLDLQDDGVPCVGEPVFLTIPEVYEQRDLLIGTTINLLAHATPESLLVHDWNIYSATQKQPDGFSLQLQGGVTINPVYREGAWLQLTGVLDINPTEPDENLNLVFIPSSVLALVPSLPVNLGNWRPASWPPSAECDTCKFAVFISGGWKGNSSTARGSTGGSNRADYWDDIVDFYCYKRSHNYCENQTQVFYYKGERPTGHTRRTDVPAGRVDSCTEGKIQAHFAALSSQIAACKRAGKCPMLEVMVTNHGDPSSGGNQGGITMVHSAVGEDTTMTGREFRQAMQQLVDSGLCVLDAEFGQCFSGIMVNELRDSLNARGCNVTAASAADAEKKTRSNPGDGGYNYWLNAKVCALQNGANIHEAVNVADRTYDQVLRDMAAASGARAQVQDGIAADGTRPAGVRTRAGQRAAEERADSTDVTSRVGKHSYFRSFCLPKRCQSDTIQVTRGGRIDVTFSGPAKSCGNCEVLCQDTTGKWVRLVNWNWNVPGSTHYVNGQNVRRIESSGASNGIYVIHSRSDTFYVKATSTNPPLPPSLMTDPSNWEDFSGFAVGWTTGTSDEFGTIVAGSYTIADVDDDGFDLTTAPKSLGSGGVETLYANYTIPALTYWWADMQVYVGVINGVAGTELFVEAPGYEHTTHNALLSGGAEEIVFGLGSPAAAGDYSLHLFASGPIELDYWGLETGRSTGVPLAVSDLTILRVGNDIQLFWTDVPVATSYLVQTSTSFGGPWTDLATVGAPGYTHVNQANVGAQQLYYQVIAVGP